ncbi:MAG TPA: alpha-amylase family protein [Candidatus Acidoferrales bacterium]|nr:alpha-amylase family protein [Candidatus Acidoferrales bacterium]
MNYSSWLLLAASTLLLFLLVPKSLQAQNYSNTVIWSESGLPSADSASASPAQLAQIFPDARILPADQLVAALTEPQTRLLVLPQSSVIPEAAFSGISDFLHRGGDLLVLGGRPFTRAAFHDDSGWHLRDYSTRFCRPLQIDQYQNTPGSSGAIFTPNPEIPIDLLHFSWKQAFSPIIRLSTNDLYPRGGSAGSLDTKLDALVWGVTDGRRLSAPLLQIDHFSSGFDGGRWVFLTADLAPDFYSSPDSTQLLRTLADRALQGALEFSVRPALPLYLPGEPVELESIVHLANKPAGPLTIQVFTYPEDQPAQKKPITISLPATEDTVLSATNGKGLQIIEARLLEGTALRAIYHSAFWIRDEAFLRSGPRLAVNTDYFTIDDKPLAIVGTTYMSSEVQRLFFDHPNVYVWNSDLSLIHSAGVNMIRTGWWTGWDKLCDESGRPYDRTLRTLEAYLMTARKNKLPVQFNFFAFLPEILGGANPYLDGEAVRRQQTLVGSVAARFHDVPFLAWDLINEPSFSKQLWRMRPNYDPVELAAWNAWLAQKYPDRASLAAAWNVLPTAVAGTISLPIEEEFAPRGMYDGINSLRVNDYVLFAQEKFAGWVRGMREAIRGVNSNAPITVGQDEGGYVDRLNPAFFAPYVDFTTNHSWWQNDHLLWDSLVAKQPGKAMLIQETGLQRELTLDEIARRTPEQESMLLERKFALSFVQGSGAIQWLWNSNSYMTASNETTIGALHADGTEKPEATILRDMAKFSVAASPYLVNPAQPAIAIVTSQAAQYSVQADLQIAAQQKAVRAIAYDMHQPCYIIAENQIDKLGSPKLVILPSPQALRESTWQALLIYVRNGGNLLVTGPVSRDEYWHLVDRYTPLGIKATTEPLTFHNATIGNSVGLSSEMTMIQLSFNQQDQQLLEYLHFDDGSAIKDFPLGRGQLFWAAYPIELAEASQTTSLLYRQVLERTAISPSYEGGVFAGDGVLLYPIHLENAMLYILESESDHDAYITIKDAPSGLQLPIHLPSQRAAIALIDQKAKQVVAKYGF